MRLDDLSFDDWCKKLNLSGPSRAIVERIRTSQPYRSVRSVVSFTGRYPSENMGLTIQFESHKVELSGIYIMEYVDKSVLEYYDQPEQIKLTYKSATGRKVGVLHTPDFFVIRKDSVGYEEWKPEKKLLELAVQSPNRYFKDEEGKWHCPPGEEYAKEFGLYYTVHSSKEINWVLQRNLEYLEDFLKFKEDLEVSKDVASKVLELVHNKPGITLHDLFKNAKGATADDIYSLIATKEIYVDLQAEVITERPRVHVFPDEQTAQAYIIIEESPVVPIQNREIELNPGQLLIWDSKTWMVLNKGESTTVLRAENEETILELKNNEIEGLIDSGKITGHIPESQVRSQAYEIIQKAGPEALKEANRRYAIIAPLLRGEPLEDPSIPARTARFWKSNFLKAEKLFGIGYIGLISRESERGNRNCHYKEAPLKAMDEIIENEYFTDTQRTIIFVYGLLKKYCEEQGIPVPSYEAFCYRIRNRLKHEKEGNRKGPRAAHPFEPFYIYLDYTTPPHGSRPFEIGHIDHTELDLKFLHSDSGTPLGKAWLTVLLDAFCREILAFYLTYDEPSYRSCMMVLRECVKRHGRLPNTICVDNGSEFHSIYFETFNATWRIITKWRPAGKPRSAAEMERLFGTVNSQVIHNLKGNTQIMKNVRQVTKANNPDSHAIWTLPEFYNLFYEWAFEIYNKTIHPAIGQSPQEAFDQGMELSGERKHRKIAYDETFLMSTMPTNKTGSSLVQPARGVKINNRYFWSDAFRKPEVELTKVPVRYDPFNAGIAYAYVKGCWVECISEKYWAFQNRTEKEMQLATAELKRQDQLIGRKYVNNINRLAEKVISTEASAALERQRLHDQDQRKIFSVMEGGRKKQVGLPPTNLTVIEGKKMEPPQTFFASSYEPKILEVSIDE